jgi:hypothetical protein
MASPPATRARHRGATANSLAMPPHHTISLPAKHCRPWFRMGVETWVKAMSKHLLVAVNIQPTQPRYFVGYKDDGAMCETIWTNDCWKARWFDAEDAEIEALLLSTCCPSYRVEKRQVSSAGA